MTENGDYREIVLFGRERAVQSGVVARRFRQCRRLCDFIPESIAAVLDTMHPYDRIAIVNIQ